MIEKAESALIGAIDKGNITAIIFTLKTRAPDRWGEIHKKDIRGTIEDEYELSPEFISTFKNLYSKSN